MNQLAVVVGFFAAPPARQIELLPSLPFDQGAPEFYAAFTDNPLLGLAEAYQRFFRYGHDEPWDGFLERLGVPSSATWPPAMDELDYALDRIRPADQSLWTQRALTRRVEWRLVRRLAAIALEEFGWSPHVDPGNVAAVLSRYLPMLKTWWREEGQPWADVTTGGRARAPDV